MPKFLSALLLFIVLSVQAVAQKPFMRQFTFEDGLPSMEVYHVLQDNRGFVWMCTSYGVVRYNGYGFKHFTVKDGLPDNTIFDAFEDKHERIWFTSFSGALSYFDDDTIKSYRYNSQLFGKMPSSPVILKKGFYVDSLNTVYNSVRNAGLIRVDSLGMAHKTKRRGAVEVYQVDDKLMVSAVGIRKPDSLFSYVPGFVDSLSTDDLPDAGFDNSFILAEKWRGKLLILNARNLFVSDGQKWQYKKLPFQVIWSGVYQDRLWLGTRNGILIFETDDLSEYEHFLEGKAITSVMQDREGSFWLSTLKSGVYYMPNYAIRYMSAEDDLYYEGVVKLAPDGDGGIWLGYRKGSVSYLKKGKIRHIHLPIGASEGVLNLHYDASKQILWVVTDLHVFSVDRNYQIDELTTHYYKQLSAKEVLAFPDSLVLASRSGLLAYKSDSLYRILDENDRLRERVTQLFYDAPDSILYMSTLSSLWRFKNGLFVDLGAVIPSLQVRVNDMIRLNREWLVLGTNGRGLVFYNTETQVIIPVNQDSGLRDEKINCLQAQSDSTLWIGTNNGLHKLHLGDLRRSRFPLSFFSTHNGLPGQEVKDIVIAHDDSVIVATNRGLVVAADSAFKRNEVAPKVYIEEFFVQDHQFPLKRYHQVAHDKSLLRIRYAALSYRKDQGNHYRYRLLGLDSTWTYTHLREIQFSTLPPGEYEFQVHACNESGVWSHDPAVLKFEVRGPFYFSWWFLIPSMIVITILFYVLYRIRIKEIERRNQLLNSIQNYKQQILRQQMNPHFIFNTLNSIQYYLLDEDIHASISYLSKFAKLMRMILDNSRETSIPIEDEIRALELYLELEALRFEEKLSYAIIIDPKINTMEWQIPSLLLQPFVENAIKHGLMHKKGPGHVKVELRQEDERIVCRIEDDGVGREQAAKIRKSHHRSWGAQISEDRVRLLKAVYGKEVDIDIKDLFADNGKPAGTCVTISIPQIFAF